MNIAYIPVRGGSKSIPFKNIKSIAGRPLVYWSIKAACECEEIDEVYVSTDSGVIRDVVMSFNLEKVKVVDRSEQSATDTASTELGMLEFAKTLDFTNIALIQATSPLTTANDLKKGFDLKKKHGVDSILSVVRQKRFIWKDESKGYAAPINYNYLERPRRQEFDGFLAENGAFYITGRSALLKTNCRISGNIKTVEMPAETYVELDEPEDWHVIEALLLKRGAIVENLEIKMFLTDCDGTLTDGGMYYSESGEALKKFNTRDGAGLRMLKERGIITGIITGEMSESVRVRAEKIMVDELVMGVSDKLSIIKELCQKYGVEMRHVAYIGDDLNDLGAIQNVGIGICVADAIDIVKNSAILITKAKGGESAVREAAEFILRRMGVER